MPRGMHWHLTNAAQPKSPRLPSPQAAPPGGQFPGTDAGRSLLRVAVSSCLLIAIGVGFDVICITGLGRPPEHLDPEPLRAP